MKGRNALRAVIVLAIISTIGIIGMLLVDGAADALLLALAALPLAFGFWRWRAESRN